MLSLHAPRAKVKFYRTPYHTPSLEMMRAKNIPTRPMSLLPLLLLLGRGAVRADFDFGTCACVYERVASFMDATAANLHQLERYRSNEVFPHDLGSPDRDAFFRLNRASMETYPQFKMIYYGLEDGTFAGQSFSNKAMYREPGHSGYSIAVGDDGSEVAEDPAMEKHYKSCINTTSGENVPCRMKPGKKYTECTAPATNILDSEPFFDCILERCADEDSQRDCEAIWNETEKAECLSNVKLCSSYAIKEAPENVTLGYIPRSDLCIDQTGVPTQTPGKVLDIDKRVMDQKGLGNCYYEDGTTLVERNIEGDYAYCGGNGKVCGDSFVGAFRSRDYDPRWRGWYTDTKALQKPNWSPSYPFFPHPHIGITYSVPIYTTHEDGLKVFAGVLAVDYTFREISNFLQDKFKNSSTAVAIFEQAEPHYMIASSTGGNTLEIVLEDDESKPCPDIHGKDSGCKSVRIRAADFSDSNVAVAFLNQKDRGFPETDLVATMTVDENVLYATHSTPFSIENAELDWTIMVMSPVEIEEMDAILPKSSLHCPLIALASFGFLLCSGVGILLVRNRTHREVIYSDWRFMSAFVGGCALLNASCLSFLGENTDGLCLTRMWLLHFSFVLPLSFLFVKTHRMYKLVGSGFRRTTITHAQTARMTLPLIGLQTLILLLFTFVDPNKRMEVISTEGSDISLRYTCAHDTSAFFIVMLLYEGGLILVGCVLAYKTRNLSDEYNESKQIILAMYDTAVVGSATLLVSKASETYQAEQRILFTLGVFWTTSFASLVFVLPRLMQVQKRLSNNTLPSTVKFTGGDNSGVGRRQNDGHGHTETHDEPPVRIVERRSSLVSVTGEIDLDIGNIDLDILGDIDLDIGSIEDDRPDQAACVKNENNSEEETTGLKWLIQDTSDLKASGGKATGVIGSTRENDSINGSYGEQTPQEEVAPVMGNNKKEEDNFF